MHVNYHQITFPISVMMRRQKRGLISPCTSFFSAIFPSFSSFFRLFFCHARHLLLLRVSSLSQDSRSVAFWIANGLHLYTVWANNSQFIDVISGRKFVSLRKFFSFDTKGTYISKFTQTQRGLFYSAKHWKMIIDNDLKNIRSHKATGLDSFTVRILSYFERKKSGSR